MSEPEYDETTCITAGELRAAGVDVPSNIPDVGWVRRSSMVFGASTAKMEPDGRVYVGMPFTFTEPFRWIVLSVEVKDEG